MDKRVLFLKLLASEKIGRVKPQTSPESPYGYCYPEAQKAFETNPGEEIEDLEPLAEQGYLAREFHDKIHLCPSCSHFALNFREVCPHCEGVNIALVQMIHHMRCGCVAPELEFQQGLQLVCPKCSRPLRHIGVDYERPSANYLCAACKHIFSEPRVSILSLSCGQVFPGESLVTRTIYAYSLTQKGVLAADRGVIEEREPPTAFIDAAVGLYTSHFFEEHLQQEIRAARRYQRPLSIELMSIDHLGEYEAKFGKVATASVLKTIVQVIKETLRDTDVPASYGDETLAILLSQTPFEGAYISAERARRRVFDLEPRDQEPRITVSVGLAGLWDGQETVSQIIDLAKERMQAAKEAGGNCVQPKQIPRKTRA